MFVISHLCCNFQPCDAADVQESTAQEKERSPHELLLSDNGTRDPEHAFSHFIGWFVGFSKKKKKDLLMIPLWLTAELENVLLELSRTESEAEEERSSASDPAETADLPDILDQSAGAEDVAGSFVDLKMEEEQREACALPTGQGEFEEEPSSPESEEEGDAPEEKTATEPARPDDGGEAELISWGNLE